MQFLTEFVGSHDGFRKHNGSAELDSFLLAQNGNKNNLVKTLAANFSQDQYNRTRLD